MIAKMFDGNINGGLHWEDTSTCSYIYIYPTLIKIIRDINLPDTAQILDVGCGGGKLISDLYNLGYKNIYGFDISESGVQLAKREFPHIADRFIIHNAYQSQLPANFPEKFDLIISTEVIEHLFSPAIYLKNIYNWLTEYGYLIISTPYHGFLKNLAIILLNRFDSHFNPLSEGWHIKFFSKKTITKLLNNTGFKIVDFYGAGRIPFFWKSMIIAARKDE